MSDQEDFWNYAVAVYERARTSCLELQDDFGFEVNLLLFCCWRGSRGVALDARTLVRIIDASADWRANVVEPLRATRRWLKGRAAPLGAEELRGSVLGLELEGERLLQALIVETASRAMKGERTTAPEVDRAEAWRITEQNLTTYQRIADHDEVGNSDELVRRLLVDVFAGGAVESIVGSNLGAEDAPHLSSERESEIE